MSSDDMSIDDNSTLIENVVICGLDDWVDEAQISGNIARRVVEDAEDRRAVAIGLIQSAILRGLVIPGSIGDDGFEPWETTPEEAAIRVARGWMAIEVGTVWPGQIVWLRNTELGNKVARVTVERNAPGLEL